MWWKDVPAIRRQGEWAGVYIQYERTRHPWIVQCLLWHCSVMQHAEVCRMLERTIVLSGSLRRAAVVLGISPQYLSAVLASERAIGKKLLKALSLKRTIVKVVTYESTGKKRHAQPQ